MSKAKITDAAVKTVDDSCSYLGVSRATLYRLINDEQLRTLKIRNRTMLKVSDLDAYLESCVVPR